MPLRDGFGLEPATKAANKLSPYEVTPIVEGDIGSCDTSCEGEVILFIASIGDLKVLGHIIMRLIICP